MLMKLKTGKWARRSFVLIRCDVFSKSYRFLTTAYYQESSSSRLVILLCSQWAVTQSFSQCLPFRRLPPLHSPATLQASLSAELNWFGRKIELRLRTLWTSFLSLPLLILMPRPVLNCIFSPLRIKKISLLTEWQRHG